jgi:hypothetical protein
MKNSISGIATGLVLIVGVGVSSASAAPVSVTGATALAVAAVVAQYSPLLSAGDKRALVFLSGRGQPLVKLDELLVPAKRRSQ